MMVNRVNPKSIVKLGTEIVHYNLSVRGHGILNKQSSEERLMLENLLLVLKTEWKVKHET